MPCNKKTCPDYKPRGRALPGYGRGVLLTKETFPKRDTSQINVPGWDRDAVMYPYEDKCERPILTYEGGGITSTTETDPDTGTTTTTETANPEEVFSSTAAAASNAGKVYEELTFSANQWWTRFTICGPYFQSGGSYGTDGDVSPIPYRYWEHYPAELSFEPNFSDSPFLYLWDTQEHLSGKPCYAICWTLSRVPVSTANAGDTYQYIYTPKKTPFECDATPDETYVEYYTQDGKLTPPGDPNMNPLIWAVGTKTEGILFRYETSCGDSNSNFANATIRLVGDIRLEDYHGLGPEQIMLTRSGGTTNRWLYCEYGVGNRGVLSSDNRNNIYNTTAEIKNSSNQTVAIVGMSIRPAKGAGDTGYPDSEVKITSVRQGSVLPVPGRYYDLNITGQTGSTNVFIGKIKFTDIADVSSGSCSGIVDGFKLYLGGATNPTYTDDASYIRCDIGPGSGIVNGIGGTVWSPGNSGLNSVQRIFNFEGSSAVQGPTTGSGLRVEILLEKFIDSQSERDTKVTVIRVVNGGDGKYQVGQVFPITFESGGNNYTAGYIKINSVTRGSIDRGIPTGLRLAEPKVNGGVYAVSHSTWTSWANNYAIWCNNRENNLSGRPLSIIHKSITLPAGSYTAEIGFDDIGSVLIRNGTTGTTLYEVEDHVGGIPNSSSTTTGSFTLATETVIDVMVELQNNPGASWSTNPAGWAITLTRGGTIEWSTRDAVNGINVGDVYKGMLWTDTPFIIAWNGGGDSVPFVSPQGGCWSARNAITYKDYEIPGGLKIRMKLESLWNEDTDSFNTRWTIDRILSYGSGYGSLDRADFSEGGSAFSDQQIYYLYYPSADTPKEQRIGISLVISDTQDFLSTPTADDPTISAGDTINGWTVEAVNRFDDGFNAGYAKLVGGGNPFTKDTSYSTNNGGSVKVIAGYGIKDRGALFGKYEFSRKQIQYGTARVTEGLPFDPELIRPRATGIITNGVLTGFQITQPGLGLSNPNIEPVVLAVDPPPGAFDHQRFNELLRDKSIDVQTAILRCTGNGRQAQVEPVIRSGRLQSIRIIDGGSGYSSSNPPEIRIPYIRRINRTVLQEQSTTAERQSDVQSLMRTSPAYPDTNTLTDYNASAQISYNEITFDRPVADINEIDLQNEVPRSYLLEPNTISEEWMNQFRTDDKSEFQFTTDVQITRDALISRSNRLARRQLDSYGNTNLDTTINTDQYLSAETRITAEDLQIARSGSIDTNPSAEPISYQLDVGALSGDVQSATTSAISNIEDEQRDLQTSTSTTTSTTGGIDFFPQEFRDFMNTSVSLNPQGSSISQNTAVNIGNVSGVLSDIENEVNTLPAVPGDTAIDPNPSGPRTLTRTVDDRVFDVVNQSHNQFIEQSTLPRTPEQRTVTVPDASIKTVEGGFYKLPCSTDRTKYLIQAYCPDPREATYINVRLGVKINQDPLDPNIGRCERCLLDNPTYQAALDAIDDPDATIVDGFCKTVWLDSIFGSLSSSWVEYTIRSLANLTGYKDADNVVYEGIRSWEISGNLEIIHDLTQETNTFVDSLNKYGNPYDYYCSRQYGDLNEDQRYQLDNASLEEDDEAPDQLADTNPAII